MTELIVRIPDYGPGCCDPANIAGETVGILVRCKDCVYYNSLMGDCKDGRSYPSPNWFCADGKRKEGR